MIILLVVIHVVVCVLLITLVLIQRGRGGGLVESFAGVESMFGTKTNAFLTRATTVLSVVFFFTCLSLAILSVKQSKSLLSNIKPAHVTVKPPVAKPEGKPLAPASPAVAAPVQPAQKAIDATKANQKQ